MVCVAKMSGFFIGNLPLRNLQTSYRYSLLPNPIAVRSGRRCSDHLSTRSSLALAWSASPLAWLAYLLENGKMQTCRTRLERPLVLFSRSGALAWKHLLSELARNAQVRCTWPRHRTNNADDETLQVDREMTGTHDCCGNASCPGTEQAL
ncbi:hypothetical protein BV20DRAFT_671804 [Pilatotrama ljubarskyi]|nr:hypothetical protein BV20DRAFT_671804 [Pilatotrama ljubarskyi]